MACTTSGISHDAVPRRSVPPLPVAGRPAGFHARTVNGEGCQFCCYGCCIAYQVKSGSGEASEAAWFLVRLGVGSFLSMNIMLFSLLVYSGAFTGADRRGAAHDSSVALGTRDARGSDSRRTFPA